MALLQLPVSQDLPWFDFIISLSGQRYGIEMRYNTRHDRWHLTLNDALGNPILEGLPLLTNRAVTAQYRTYAVPPGDFVVVDTTGKDQPATLNSFKTTHALLYVTKDA